MAKFEVEFVPEALQDIQDSYEWGVENWGKPAADKWFRELHRAIYERLTMFPAGCPRAPEAEDLSSDIRHCFFLRYRIVFEIRKRQVIVLRVAGAYRRGYDDE